MIEDLPTSIPSPTRITRIRLQRNSVFIAAAGFEDRAAAGVRLLEKAANGNVLVVKYKPGARHNNDAPFIDALRLKGVPQNRISTLDYRSFDPHHFAKDLRTRLNALRVDQV